MMPKQSSQLNPKFGLPDLIRQAGSNSHHQNVINYLTQQVPIDIEWIIRYSPFSIPTLLHCNKRENANSQIDLEVVNQLYYEGYYRLDPWYRYWREDGRGGVLTPDTLGRTGESKDDFYSALRPFLGDMDVIAIFLPIMGRSAITYFLERKEKFSKKEIAFVESTYETLSALQNLHEQFVLGSARSTSNPSQEDSNIYMLLGKNGRCLHSSKGWQKIAQKDPEFAKITNAFSSGPTPNSVTTDHGILHFEDVESTVLWGASAKLVFLELGNKAKTSIGIDNALNEFVTDELTPREREIIRLILLGCSNEKISEELRIGVGTIRNHRKRLYQKFDVTAERELFTKFLNFLDEKFL